VKVRAGQKRAQIAGVYPAVGPRGVGEVKEGRISRLIFFKNY
jgi:hypothetical protein